MTRWWSSRRMRPGQMVELAAEQPTEPIPVAEIRRELGVSVAAGLDALCPTTGQQHDLTGFSDGIL